MINCDTEDHGCYGGELSTGYHYVSKYGLDTDEDYPYTGKEDYCKYSEY